MRNRKTLLIIAMMLSVMLVFTACSDRTKMLGRWNVTKITAGDLVMEADELEELGLTSAGFLKLNKSGSCVVNLLGDEYEGTWEFNESDGTATVTYDDGSKQGSAVRKDKVITFTDAEGNEYEMQK